MARKKQMTAGAKAKKVAKTGGAVAAAGYAWRLQISGQAAARKAQKTAVRNDVKRVGRVAGKTAVRAGNTKVGLKVSNTRPAIGAAMVGERAGRKAKAYAPTPGALGRNVKRDVKRSASYVKEAHKGDVAFRQRANAVRNVGNPTAVRVYNHVGDHKVAYTAAGVGTVATGAYLYHRHKAHASSATGQGMAGENVHHMNTAIKHATGMFHRGRH